MKKNKLQSVRMNLITKVEPPKLIKVAEKKKGRPPKLYKLDDFEVTGSVMSNISDLHERGQ